MSEKPKRNAHRGASAGARGAKDGCNVEELCAALDISRQTVTDWRAKDWLVWAPSGQWYDAEATRARVLLMRGPQGGKVGGVLANLPPDPVVHTITADDAERIRNLPPDLADLPADVIARRLKVAQMLQAEADASLAEAKLAIAQGDSVPAAEAAEVVRRGAALVAEMFAAEIETAAVAGHARWAIPLTDCRVWLKDWVDAVLTRCANTAELEAE